MNEDANEILMSEVTVDEVPMEDPNSRKLSGLGCPIGTGLACGAACGGWGCGILC